MFKRAAAKLVHCRRLACGNCVRRHFFHFCFPHQEAPAQNTHIHAPPWKRISGGPVHTAAEAGSEWQLCMLVGGVIGFEGRVTEVRAANGVKQQGEVTERHWLIVSSVVSVSVKHLQGMGNSLNVCMHLFLLHFVSVVRLHLYTSGSDFSCRVLILCSQVLTPDHPQLGHVNQSFLLFLNKCLYFF